MWYVAPIEEICKSADEGEKLKLLTEEKKGGRMSGRKILKEVHRNKQSSDGGGNKETREVCDTRTLGTLPRVSE